jgi:hypothetical protein
LWKGIRPAKIGPLILKGFATAKGRNRCGRFRHLPEFRQVPKAITELRGSPVMPRIVPNLRHLPYQSPLKRYEQTGKSFVFSGRQTAAEMHPHGSGETTHENRGGWKYDEH